MVAHDPMTDLETGRDLPAKGAARTAALPVTRLLPAYQQVADQLRELILRGDLVSGDRLPPESELGTQFGVSRSTVREALRVLSSHGITKTTRGTTGGTFVARVDATQISDYLETSIGLMAGGDISLNDLLEARRLIEVESARLAALRREDHHVAALFEAIEKEKALRERDSKFIQHVHFHLIVSQATNNGLLTLMAQPTYRVLQTRFLRDNLAEDFWSVVDRDHDLIATCIEQGDSDGAASAMSEHLSNIRSSYE
jgi:GntR family transcriptional repressor for pyruvate dehydrogenase complex